MDGGGRGQGAGGRGRGQGAGGRGQGAGGRGQGKVLYSVHNSFQYPSF